MKNFDICLYGHITFDNILFDDFSEVHSVGAIANTWAHLIKIDPFLKIKIYPCAWGEALILVDKKKAKRASVANLNLTEREVEPQSSHWHHIMYINELSNVKKWIGDLDGVVSADVCKGERLDLNMLKFLDYLFISDEDVYGMGILDLAKQVKGWVIMHHKGGSVCSDGEGLFSTSVGVIDGVNVLGAGDMFAATVIQKILKNKEKFPIIIKSAHQEVTNLLKKEKV